MAVQNASRAVEMEEELAVNHVYVEDICDETWDSQKVADEIINFPFWNETGGGFFLPFCANVLRQ